MLLASVTAILAAAIFATSTALLHRSAGIVAGAAGGPGVARFIVRTAVHPVWLVGMAGQIVGFGVHAVALHAGPLTLVQPLMVTEVVFALLFRELLESRWPGAKELMWASLLCVGLALFLVSATPAEGPTSAPDTMPTLVAAVTIAAGMGVAAFAGRSAKGSSAAAVLAAGAGLGFAGVAGLLKEVTIELGHGVATVVTSWPVYGLAAAGAGGMLLTQLAYRAAPLRASLPTMSTIDTMASLAIGVAVFDEPFRRAPLALSGELAGLLAVVAGLVCLSPGLRRHRPLRP